MTGAAGLAGGGVLDSGTGAGLEGGAEAKAPPSGRNSAVRISPPAEIVLPRFAAIMAPSASLGLLTMCSRETCWTQASRMRNGSVWRPRNAGWVWSPWTETAFTSKGLARDWEGVIWDITDEAFCWVMRLFELLPL